MEEKIKNIIEKVYEVMPEILDEKQLRILTACIAEGYGYGGITEVHKISGIARSTIYAGIEDIKNKEHEKSTYSIRKEGGGRKLIEEKEPKIINAIEEIVDGSTYGNPEKIISYTTLSLRKIAEKLETDYNIKVSHTTVKGILEFLGYSKHQNQKMLQVGEAHPDRNAQFEFINKHAKEFLDSGDPVISVDTKKKENIGNFKNAGAEYRKKGDPRKVLDHDFPLNDLGKAVPYGVYNLNNNTGFVNVGNSHDTAEFAVESIRIWWNTVGKNTFPDSKRLYINCDGGGSNASNSRHWKYELARFAQETGLEIHVSHFPPGTSKWNKIEHRLFCYISKNWQGKPLVDIDTIVNLIGSTSTKNGLKVICRSDSNVYNTGIKISDANFKNISISSIGSFDAWNYTISGFTV